MLNSSFKKNLSIKEHRSILRKRYLIKRISTNGLVINEHGCFSYIETLKDIDISGVMINGYELKKMFYSGFLNYGIGEIISFKNGFLLNENTGAKIDFNCTDNNLFFDTSILYFNYLNNKTINHFSWLYVKKNEVFYKMRRSNWIVLFSLKLN